MNETHAIDSSCFEYRLRDYVQNTLVDTIVDRYAHADDSESLSLRLAYDLTIASMLDSDNEELQFDSIYIHPLWEVFTFAEFQAHELTIDLTDCNDLRVTLSLSKYFDFSKLTFRASADAAYFMSAVAACLAENKVTVHADAFKLNTL